MVSPGDQPDAIAIVGVGLRLPGSCHDAKSYWNFLVGKRDARRTVPPERFNVDGFYQSSEGGGGLSVKHGYFLDEPVDRFDAAFFSMSQREVERVDPQQRLLLEVVYEALENAGETNWEGKDIGVYTGSFGQDWIQMHAKDPQDGSTYDLTSNDDFVMANRVSYQYDLRGPSMSIKVGCSSSLVALHLACEALQRGDCSAAVVGGSNLLLSPEYFTALDNMNALSYDGSSKSFDARANGYARADGVNAVYLKRFDDAIRDGNPIRAIVRGTAVNADGKTMGLTKPSSDAQTTLIRRAYEKAGISNPGGTPFVECHGTGTAAGDPLELAAVARVFGGQGTYIGSVKPNIGHGEGAAGLSSLIKAVLALEEQTIPPNIKFHTPNPKIPFTESKLVVPTGPTPWPSARCQRISVNSFGIGGANAHVILDAAPSLSGTNGTTTNSSTNGWHAEPERLLVFSAHSEPSLKKILSSYNDFVESESFRLSDLAYTLGAKRRHRTVRSFCVTNGMSFEPSSPCKTAEFKGLLFIFTGQGAQWPGMGQALLRDFPSFRKDIKKMDSWLSGATQSPAWKIEDILSNSDQIDSAELSQPLCTAIQLGLVNLLKKWNVHPAAVVGHSSGEIAAAYAAGAIGMKEALLIAFYRGVATTKQHRPGAMAAVGLGREELSDLLAKDVTIACENSRSSVTISGDSDDVDTVLEQIQSHRPGAFARKLRVNQAYHSSHMKAVGTYYQQLMDSLETTGENLTVPLFSSVTGHPIYDASSLGPSYWRSNLENPVLFLSAVESALRETDRFSMAVEIGPHSALSGPFRQICKDMKIGVPYTSLLNRGANCTNSCLTALGQLYCHGLVPDFAALNPGGVTKSNLPTYQWDHATSYWHESRVSRDFRMRKHAEHELLGARTLSGNDLEPSWRKLFHLRDVPWLSDHLVSGEIIFPAVGYISIAGEAIKQLSESSSFTIRGLNLVAAMHLPPGAPIEIITQLRPCRPTTNYDSSWFDFTIMSYDGTQWTRHCFGEVHAGQKTTSPPSMIDTSNAWVAQPLSTERWYQDAKTAGLEYGPAFQGLRNVHIGLNNRSVISATVSEQRHANESPYSLHPTTIDQLLQCCILRSTKGHLSLMKTTVLPISFEEIYVGPESGPQGLALCADVALGRNMLSAHGYGQGKDGSIIMQAKGIRFRLLDNPNVGLVGDPMQQLRLLQWKPDIDLINPGDLIHETTDLTSCLVLVEKLNILCSIETTITLKAAHSSLHHMEQFKRWNEEFITGIRSHGSNIVPDTNCLFDMCPETRQQLIKQLLCEAIATPAKNAATAVTRIYDAVEDIFSGKQEPLAILLADNVLMELYNFFNILDHSQFFQLLGHSNPEMRILEIGAGTGGFTSTILPALTGPKGDCLFSTYTYTDISSGFFKAAKERFRGYPGLEAAVLDISRDPASQGLEVNSYDLVVASNVLHATPDLHRTLTNCRSLLRPGGRIFMLELCTEAKWINYIMGTLSGWWLGESDGRRGEPYLQAEQWNAVLQKAGFDKIEAAVMDQAMPYQLDNIIIAKAQGANDPSPKRLSLLLPDAAVVTVHAEELRRRFQSVGYEVSLRSLWDLPTESEDIVSMLDIDGPTPFFEGLSEEHLDRLIRFIMHSTANGSKVLWLTGPSQILAQNPYHALVLGFARTLRLELGTFFASMELDITVTDSSPLDSVVRVFTKLQDDPKDASSRTDFEYVVVNDTVHIPRFISSDVNSLLCSSFETQPGVAKRLNITTPGKLGSLHWAIQPWEAVLQDRQVEINVRAASVNSNDLSMAMRGADRNQHIGLDCAGVIVDVGPKANTDFKVGDRVICWYPGALATHVRVDAQWCVKIPDNLPFDEAASLVTVHATMIRGLVQISNLAQDESILIHSAAGAVGIAAIQIAQMIGAEVFATVATDEEKAFLEAKHGIPQSHIFSVNSFVADIMRSTQSRGVDVVINSPPNDLLHDSWKCVAEGGNMVDLVKRNAGHGKPDMDLLERNRVLCGVDIPALFIQKPRVASRLLQMTMEMYWDGSIKPIFPITKFEPSEIKEAFHHLQSGQHIGGVCVEYPDDSSIIPGELFTEDIRFRTDRSYILTGGLGCLGRSAAIWLAQRGAGQLIFLTRSSSTIAAGDDLINLIKSLGSTVQILKGSVTEASLVQRLVDNAEKPIAGVLHMAQELKDEPLPDMSFGGWTAATEAKVEGTWNLHRALKGQDLDFFVLTSSTCGVQGNPGQANSAAAGSFLDAFVQFRQNQGLPASVIDLGAVEDNRQPFTHENGDSSKTSTIQETEFLQSLHLAIRSSPRTAASPRTTTSSFINPSQFVVGAERRPHDARELGLRSHETKDANDGSPDSANRDNTALQTFMENAKRDPTTLNDEDATTEFLAKQVAECLKTLLIFSDDSELSLSRGLSDFGVDSLISIELRNWWTQNLGSQVTVSDLTQTTSLIDLGKLARARLLQSLNISNGHHP
ncbi:Type I Iterative PKS [Onygenales sp. PD_12]|nr:Type I Iterative PKS [Onygenales sp. PD_12]